MVYLLTINVSLKGRQHVWNLSDGMSKFRTIFTFKIYNPPLKTVHIQVVIMTYLCTTVHKSYLQPLITFSSNRRKNRLHAVSNIRNSIRLVDRQPKKHIGCGDAWTSLTIEWLCGQEKYYRTLFVTNQKGPFYAGWKEHRQRLQHNWSFQPNTIGLARLYIFTELLDDLKQRKRFWHLREKALEYTLEKSLLTRLWTYRKTDYVMTEMLLFCKAEENHENKVDRMSRRVSVLNFWTASLQHRVASNNALPVGYTGGVNGENKWSEGEWVIEMFKNKVRK